MSNYIRSILHSKVSHCFQNADPEYISLLISNLLLKFDNSTRSYTMQLPLKSKQYNIEGVAKNLAKHDNYFQSINFTTDDNDRRSNTLNTISFHVSRDTFVKTILENNIETIESPNYMSCNKNIIVEFSSPNVAKPFHVGHLRSTIIGNYISNVNAYLGNKVKKINYLGDWGTQFGFVQVGLNLKDFSKCMETDPIQTLYSAYVLANKHAETDPTIKDKARDIFQNMEKGDSTLLKNWEIIKHYTIDELKKTYGRINITFDEYHWESMYGAKQVESIISLMKYQGLLVTDEENRVIINLDEKRKIPLLKSDGSTLYILRDIAAAIDRFEKYCFDCMYYVVDNSQTAHFSNLFDILHKMQLPWAGKLKHIKFGKINGMSTRMGNVIFLKDLLNEMRIIMADKQIQCPNTKVPLDLSDNSADILGISAIVINDMKQKRNRHYKFEWDSALDVKGETGVKLQYTHARLVSLEENCGAVLPLNCDPSLLQELCVDDLIFKIGTFEEIIFRSHKDLEPYILVRYLFHLSHAINGALKILRIKGESPNIGSQRLLLFRVARNVLAQGMKLLGLTPLNKM